MSKAFYITSVSNGLVLAHQPSGKPSGVAVENKGDDGDREKWTVEAGDEPNVIALKNASNGEYLHANGGTNWSTVGTGAKQWWKISNDNVTAPGACGLSPVEYPNVFLNHFQGKPARQFKDQVKVHMWKWEASCSARIAKASYPYWFSWYFLDANVEFNPLASSTTEGSTSSADVEAKMKALEERENALAQKETDRSAEWDEKMKTVKGREASLAQEEEKRTASYDERLKDLQDREAALAKREEETKASKGRPDKDSTPADDEAQAKRESEIQRKLDDLKSAEQRLASDRAALEKSKSALTAKEKDLGQRQKEFEDQKASAKQGGGQNRVERPTKSALERKQQDNAALEERLAKLEDRLEQMKKSPDVASDKQQANSKVNGKTSGTALVDGQSPGCGYKHYKPPRKLNRRVIGIVYQ